jgi:uncharacterized damage-inducible protein DinB
MARRPKKYWLVLIGMLLLSAGTVSADSGYTAAFRAHWKRISDMFIQIVGAMPEDKYDFRPTAGYRSFRELVMHAIEDNYTHMGYVAGKSREESEKLAAKYKNVTTRAEMMDALEDGYNYGDMMLAQMNDQNASEVVAAMRGQKTTRAGAALQAFEDTMDHYGNLVVYLRLNGIVPPETANRGKPRQGQQREQEH